MAPCGSGKLDCALKGALVKRILEKEPRGVTLLVQPLTGLQREVALKANAAVLSMAQELTVMEENDVGVKAELSCSLEDLIAGKYSVLIGHPESFTTALGQRILAELQLKSLILMVVLDEFHQGCEGHWMSFRPQMLRISCGLRVFARKNASVIAMTATAEQKDIRSLVDMLGLRTKPVVIAANPVQEYQKFSVLQRPSNCYGLLGKLDKKGNLKPGLWQLLERLYLGQFLRDLNMGHKSKRCIIYMKNNVAMGALYSLLQKLSGQYDPSTADFVMCHSSLLPPDDRMLERRRDEITLYLASNRMLLGMDVKKVGLAIFAQPFDMPAALLQGGGRLSRRTCFGYRTSGQVYQLWNSSDLTLANKEMSEDMRRLCRDSSFSCTKEVLGKIFEVDVSVFQEQVSTKAQVTRVEDKLTVELLEKQKQEKHFKLLQRKLASCRDPQEIAQVLRKDGEMNQLLNKDREEVELQAEAAAGRVADVELERESQHWHCCHFHDIENKKLAH